MQSQKSKANSGAVYKFPGRAGDVAYLHLHEAHLRTTQATSRHLRLSLKITSFGQGEEGQGKEIAAVIVN